MEDPEFVKWAVARYKDRIAVGIDARKGVMAIKGWAENSNIDPVSLCKKICTRWAWLTLFILIFPKTA